VKFFSLFIFSLLLGACASSPGTLKVKQYHLRSEIILPADDPMMRMEKLRRLHGAVSAAERRERLGQYYTLTWNHPKGTGQGEVEIRFDYQQGASASLVKQMHKDFPSSAGSGSVEFAVLGDDYFTRGKVLAWKATLLRDNKVLATQQSYLWQ
jgi:hypothetical protein